MIRSSDLCRDSTDGNRSTICRGDGGREVFSFVCCGSYGVSDGQPTRRLHLLGAPPVVALGRETLARRLAPRCAPAPATQVVSLDYCAKLCRVASSTRHDENRERETTKTRTRCDSPNPPDQNVLDQRLLRRRLFATCLCRSRSPLAAPRHLKLLLFTVRSRFVHDPTGRRDAEEVFRENG
jgi:hypothetical protein